MSEDVLITWRECTCDWVTKYCEENHVKHAVVSRDALACMTAAPTGPGPRTDAAVGR